MVKKLEDKQIVRMPSIEKKYGIDELRFYAYINNTELKVIGEVFSEQILKDFCLICTVYDKDGDMIESFKNDSYGSTFVTSYIKEASFFNGYPFSMSIYLADNVEVGKIRIVPK